MKNKKITVIGGGNIGQAFTRGLLKNGTIKAQNITLTRRNLNVLSDFSNLGVSLISDNRQAVKNADFIIIAVKPFQIKGILAELADVLSENQILISMVTGVKISEIKQHLNIDVPCYRAMPNTAMMTCESMTCISGSGLNIEQDKQVTRLFKLVGEIEQINENLQEASTILGASGIAFALRYIRAAGQGGIEIGFNAKAAQRIVAQTVKGAVSLLAEGNAHPESEIDLVTTPKGVTITGLNEMEHRGFSSALIKGLTASFKKIDEL